MKSCCCFRPAADLQPHRSGAEPRPQNGSADPNGGMTILRSDTTSFGLPVARIPRLQAGKTPPRDPKIHSRLGLDPERWWERGGGVQAWTSQAALQASDGGRADNTAGMLTCQKPLQLEGGKKNASHQMSSG